MLYDLLQNKLFYNPDEGDSAKWCKTIEQNISPWVTNFYKPFVIEAIDPEKNMTGLRLRSADFFEFQPWHMSGKICEGEKRIGFLKYRPYRYAAFDYSFAGLPTRDFDPAYPRIYKNKTVVFMDLMSAIPRSLIVTGEIFLNMSDIYCYETTKSVQKLRPAANPLWSVHYEECPQIIQKAKMSTMNYAFYQLGDKTLKKGLFCKDIDAYSTDMPASGEQKNFLPVSADADWKLLLYDAAQFMIEDKDRQKQFSNDNFVRDQNTLFINGGLIRNLQEILSQSPRRVCSHPTHETPNHTHPENSKHAHKLVSSFMIKKWAIGQGMIKE